MPDADRRARWFGVAAGVVFAVVLITHYAVEYGLNVAPSPTGDEISYDIIGWNLSRGNGFSEGGQDAEFRQPYREAFPDLMPAAGPTPDPPEPVTYRPPLFPFLLSAASRLFGRQFYVARIWNALAMAAVGGLLVWYLSRRYRLPVVLAAAALFLVVDTRIRLYGRAILTEATAALLLTVITLILFRIRADSSRWLFAALGILFALLILDRTMFVLWLPGLTLLTIWPDRLTGSVPPEPPVRLTRRLGHAAVFLGCVVVCLLPWSIRNITVLGRMMPLGAQGMTQLYAGFSDHAVQQRGVWTLEAQKELKRELPLKPATRLDAERMLADESRRRAVRWIRQHPWQTVELAVWKCVQEYRPRSLTAWVITTAAVLGAAAGFRRRDIRVILLLHLINASAIAATWSVEGRFVVPLLFAVHVPAAHGLAVLLSPMLKPFCGPNPLERRPD